MRPHHPQQDRLRYTFPVVSSLMCSCKSIHGALLVFQALWISLHSGAPLTQSLSFGLEGELDPERMGSGIQYGDASLRQLRQPRGTTTQNKQQCNC